MVAVGVDFDRSRSQGRGVSLALAACLAVAACTGDATRSPLDTRTPPPAGTAADVREGFQDSVVALRKGENVDPREERLLAEAEPRASCPGSAERAEPAQGEVELEIATVERDCLMFDYEVVPVEDLEDRMTELDAAPDVVGVSPVVTTAAADQAGEARSWAHDFLDVPDPESGAWPSGRGVVVAIVDTGVGGGLDMAGQVSRRMTFPGDPGGDPKGHGTHVAGIVAAIAGNAEGIAGIAPGVEILDVPVVANDLVGAPTPADGIRWAVDNGADVINMSFSLRPLPDRAVWGHLDDIEQAASANEALEIALVYADAAGVLLIASGGNCGNGDALDDNCEGENVTTMPAAAPEVWAVAATTPSDERAPFSTEREYVDLSAPGVEILSLTADGATRPLSGTSQAAPYVAGAVALLLGSDGPLQELDENDRPRAAMRSIVRTLVDLGHPGRDASFGRGRLDINAALAAGVSASSNPFEGDWFAHSRRLRIHSDGTASYAYRLYPRPGLEFAEVELAFTDVGPRTAEAVVTSSSRPRDFATGQAVTLVLRRVTDTIELANEDTRYFDMLCGELAEPGFCGA